MTSTGGLSQQQADNARFLYQRAISRGVPPARAKELAAAAYSESSLDPTAVNKSSGAAGDFQLLSKGYVDKANAAGGVLNPAANLDAILPAYSAYWRSHPNAAPGEAAAAVEASGEGPSFYTKGLSLLGFLAGPGAAASTPAAAASSVTASSTSGDPERQFLTNLALQVNQHHGVSVRSLAPLLQARSQGLGAVQTTPDTPGNVTAALSASPTGVKAGVVGAAKTMLGTPYVWGGNEPGKALDCSGFLQQAYAQVGVAIPRTTQAQFEHGQPVDLTQIEPGDAVFTEPGKNGPKHVGMYVGNGLVQESPHTGDVNKYIPLKDFLAGGFVGARRYA